MPEGPEVKRNALALSKMISKSRLKKFDIISGRYTRNVLYGHEKFSAELACDVIGAGCHGKFIYVIFNNGWNLWSTLGMTGIWSENESKHTRVCMQTSKGNVFYNDIRNFGTLKLVYGKHALLKKIDSLGMDLLSQEVPESYFISELRKRDKKNICKVLMDQSILAGVGNYIKAEALWICRINPDRSVSDLEDFQLLELKYTIEEIMKSSYEHGGATFLTHSDFSGQKGQYTNRFLCYNRKTDVEGNVVTKSKTPDGRTTHWSKERQGE
jgi:DNA-formamidopyrimidine glycosylase